MARGFVYLAAVVDWATRRVLSHRVSITMEADFCVEALEEALGKYGKPEIFNTDQGSQFTGEAFTGVLLGMQDRHQHGRQRLLARQCLRRTAMAQREIRGGLSQGLRQRFEARASLDRYLDFYNRASEHPSVYVIEGKRLCWSRSGPAGYLALRRARFDDRFGRVSCEFGSSKDPGTIRQGVARLDLAGLRRQPQRLGRDLQKARGVGEIEPWLDAVVGGLEHRDSVVRAQRGDAFAGPAVSMAGFEAIAVEKAGDQIVAGDQRQFAIRPR